MKAHHITPEEAFELLVLLHQARDMVGKARQKELSRIGLSMSQSAILYIVKAIDGPAYPSEIGRWLNREPNTVFSLLKNMERQGLIRRAKDIRPRNRVRIELTEKGEKMNQLSQQKREIITKVMSSLTPAERVALKSLLAKIRDQAMQHGGIDRRPPFP